MVGLRDTLHGPVGGLEALKGRVLVVHSEVDRVSLVLYDPELAVGVEELPAAGHRARVPVHQVNISSQVPTSVFPSSRVREVITG